MRGGTLGSLSPVFTGSADLGLPGGGGGCGGFRV